MLPGNPQILTCPFCGKEKEVMSLLSGNTYGAVLWSDNKKIAPRLPKVSYVQKCPQCGKYYIISRQEVRYAETEWSFERGLLTFPEMKEAFFQLQQEGLENEEEEREIRMMLHHAYNDYYHRTGETKDIDHDDYELFVNNGQWLIENLITDDILKAEFYREIGDMAKAKEILDLANPEDDFHKEICVSIKSRIENNDSRVFRIYG